MPDGDRVIDRQYTMSERTLDSGKVFVGNDRVIVRRSSWMPLIERSMIYHVITAIICIPGCRLVAIVRS